MQKMTHAKRIQVHISYDIISFISAETYKRALQLKPGDPALLAELVITLTKFDIDQAITFLVFILYTHRVWVGLNLNHPQPCWVFFVM